MGMPIQEGIPTTFVADIVRCSDVSLLFPYVNGYQWMYSYDELQLNVFSF